MAREHVATLLWLSLVTVLLLTPPGLFSRPELAPAVALPYADKMVHVALFAVLGLLLARSLRRLEVARPILVAGIAAIALGGLIELVQPLVARSCELGDLLADAAGALLVSVVRVPSGRPSRLD